MLFSKNGLVTRLGWGIGRIGNHIVYNFFLQSNTLIVVSQELCVFVRFARGELFHDKRLACESPEDLNQREGNKSSSDDLRFPGC